MTTKQTITIFFSCDDNYIPFLAVSIKSLIENANKNYNYNINILNCNDINYKNKQLLKKEFETKNVFINFVDVENEINKLNKTNLLTRDYYSKAIFYRLFISQLFPDLDKAIYLDCDIVVKDDISKLYNTDIGENYVGAVADEAVLAVPEFVEYVKNKIGIADNEQYFNSGVLLLNLKKFKEIFFFERFKAVLQEVAFNIAPDQDYLNLICKGNVYYLNNKWNKMPLNDNDKNPSIIHYNLHFKPWHLDNIPYEQEFWNYAKKTSFYNHIKNIKDNYTDEQKEIVNQHTITLIKNAKNQADDKIETQRVQKVIKAINSFYSIAKIYAQNKGI